MTVIAIAMTPTLRLSQLRERRQLPPCHTVFIRFRSSVNRSPSRRSISGAACYRESSSDGRARVAGWLVWADAAAAAAAAAVAAPMKPCAISTNAKRLRPKAESTTVHHRW